MKLSSIVAAACGLAIFTGASVESAPASKARPCTAARGHSVFKIESRCINLQSGGEIRTYRIYVPRAQSKSPKSLLLVLHGGGGSGSAMEEMALGEFNRVADKHGVIVAYPDGVGRNWNDGRSNPGAKTAEEGIDDVAFLRSVVTDIASKQSIDPKRIYATGISNGGLLSYRLACDAADWIAAVAPVAANLSVELASECKPSRMTPLAIFDGTDDPIMPWIGGETKALWNRRGAVLSAQETFERWVRIGDCALPVTHMARNTSPDDGTSIVRHVARDCKNSGEVRLYEILGGGHTWPGGAQYSAERVVGKVSHEINAADEIWSFVSRYALP